jgi:ElaB protein
MGSTTSPATSTSGYTTGSAPQRAREESGGVGQSTVQAVTNAYDKTSQALTNTYDQAMTFGKEHPGQLTLIAFGAGIGVGLLLASLGGGRSRTSRIAEPVVNAISQVAMEFFR